MNPREMLGVGIRLIGIYFICDGLVQGLLAVTRLAGFDLGPTSTAARTFAFFAVDSLGGLAFLASAKEIAAAAYRGRDADNP